MAVKSEKKKGSEKQSQSQRDKIREKNRKKENKKRNKQIKEKYLSMVKRRVPNLGSDAYFVLFWCNYDLFCVEYDLCKFRKV